MKTSIAGVVLACLLITGCHKISEKAKSAANKGGEAVGETATEFVEGVGTGIEKTLVSLTIEVSPALKDKGLSTGKYTVSGTGTNENHVLNLYFIYDKDFSSPITIKAYDKEGLEMGRVKTQLTGKSGEAGYSEFVFDVKTTLENRGKIVVE